MTSIELKHQARLREWAEAIQDCRSSGLSVRQWCRERGTTPTTYYRWERELLSVASTAKALSETPAVAFAELPVPKQVCCNTTERSATLRIGNASLDIYPAAFLPAATSPALRREGKPDAASLRRGPGQPAAWIGLRLFPPSDHRFPPSGLAGNLRTPPASADCKDRERFISLSFM